MEAEEITWTDGTARDKLAINPPNNSIDPVGSVSVERPAK